MANHNTPHDDEIITILILAILVLFIVIMTTTFLNSYSHWVENWNKQELATIQLITNH